MIDAPAEGVISKERIINEGLDLWIVESNSQETLVEELEFFPVNSWNLQRYTMWEKNWSLEKSKRLKDFFTKTLGYIRLEAWGHGGRWPQCLLPPFQYWP